jgi:hypothetical protein
VEQAQTRAVLTKDQPAKRKQKKTTTKKQSHGGVPLRFQP